jgi:hypothetical protein
MVSIVVLATTATAIANAESRETLAQLARQKAGRAAGHRDAGWAQHTFLVGVSPRVPQVCSRRKKAVELPAALSRRVARRLISARSPQHRVTRYRTFNAAKSLDPLYRYGVWIV